jgi:methylenetetrahydrofolate reductase (NADH)
MEINSISRLEQILHAGRFAVTAEIGPPKSSEASVIQKKGDLLRQSADAFNLTDNQTAIVRMSSIAASRILVEMGLEPVIQMTCRDRNRIAMQSDLLGAQALGIRNVLCLSGDHMIGGNHPQARKVFDLDSVNLVQMVRGMNEGKFECGEELKPAVQFFVGAVENPFAPPYEFRPFRLRKKVEAGAQFIQTQMIFNVARFKEFMAKVCDLGIGQHAFILAGVGPLKSPGMARYMRDNVAGCEVPDEFVKRMEKTPKDKWRAEGIAICVEIIEQMKNIPGVAGVHIMSIEWEEAVPKIVEQAKLLPRPHVQDLQPIAEMALPA